MWVVGGVVVVRGVVGCCCWSGSCCLRSYCCQRSWRLWEELLLLEGEGSELIQVILSEVVLGAKRI